MTDPVEMPEGDFEKSTTEQLREFLWLYIETKKAEKTFKALDKTLKKAAADIQALYEREGTRSVRLSTGELIYVQSQYWAGTEQGYDKADVAQRMRDDDEFSSLVKLDYNATQLSAFVREQIAQADVDTPQEEIISNLKQRIPGLAITEKFYTKVTGAKL